MKPYYEKNGIVIYHGGAERTVCMSTKLVRCVRPVFLSKMPLLLLLASIVVMTACAEVKTQPVQMKTVIQQRELTKDDVRCFGIFNASAVWLHWESTDLLGVTYWGDEGDIPPLSGATIASWSPTGEECPDVLGLTPTSHFATADDLEALVGCMSGPRIRMQTDCWWYDMDHDGDVDQVDYGIVQEMMR